MKTLLLSLFLIGTVFYSNAQTYLNPGVDTSGTDVQKALMFFNEYLADFKGSELPDFSKYWGSDELAQRTIPDQLEQHKEVDLNNIQDFWYPDPFTNAGSAIQGLICQLSMKKMGLRA